MHWIMYGGEKSPSGIKRQNVWTQDWKCSICSIFVRLGFFVHFWAVVYAQSIKRTNFWFYRGFWGYGYTNGFIAQKQLISAEGCIYIEKLWTIARAKILDLVIGYYGTFVAGFLLVESQNVNFWFFGSKCVVCCTANLYKVSKFLLL